MAFSKRKRLALIRCGKCVDCQGDNPDPTWYCPRCKKKRAKVRKRVVRRRVKQGRCRECGKEKPLATTINCQRCREIINRRSKEAYLRKQQVGS